jgi:hypothetical protein
MVDSLARRDSADPECSRAGFHSLAIEYTRAVVTQTTRDVMDCRIDGLMDLILDSWRWNHSV